MRILIAPDKYKGCLSAPDVARAMERGARRAAPDATIETVPMADGGEGIVEALVAATGGTFETAPVTGPLGEPVNAAFGLLGDGRTAVLEMAAASGLVLVPNDRRDPLRTTTRGTGELLLAAIRRGAKRVILGIGGSATNDGGAGLAQALGYRLLDEQGRELAPGGGPLEHLNKIDPSGRTTLVDDVEILVACDVDNPLCGPRGASAVYGPQKGATPEMVERLDANLAHLASLIESELGPVVAQLPGAGAAGGLGAGLVAFAGGHLKRGIDLVVQAVGLDERLRRADLCLTGEGALDASSAFGKTAVGVARLARTHGCPVIALAGSIGEGAEAVLNEGVAAYLSICSHPMSLIDAMEHAPALIAAAAEQAVRVFLSGRHSRT